MRNEMKHSCTVRPACGSRFTEFQGMQLGYTKASIRRIAAWALDSA
jgi:hypothetical protein